MRTEKNNELVKEIILIQEDQPGTHSTAAEIKCKLSIGLLPVSHFYTP